MWQVLRARALAVAFLGCALAACDSTTPTTPTAPAPTTTTPFSGTITLNGASTHTFSTQAGGTVTATLTSVGREGQRVGFAMGNWFNSFCSIVVANDQAQQGAVISGNITGASQLCVRIYDPNGTLEDGPVSYSVEVVHPQ